ncbi:MAG: phosphoribosylformylglycinamidine cyclo-ligase [Candidatus Peregrinibacteria bacterium Greene0416_62]|nr:MAG: phosphoribosylformylglycinamidine cyclo-ligase [Candidatus Peregrinibacteria bacterium Greene0416_62]TSC99843.1 MAG: phosphoribosylformylglycinamidine cyclo-ligase [Candidatus Peregrinibacteria bacterium Greene1014_49]
MTTYKDSGVDVAAGDTASKAAYNAAASTFASRKGMIGAPVFEEGGYAGLLDMGDYYLVMTDDGTGTKIDVALAAGNCKTLGSDLLAMVTDDAVCTGAEVIAVSNTIDIAKVDPKIIGDLMEGLSNACSKQKIVIPAGEIAEVPGAVHSATWSATAVGIVAKDRVINTRTIAPGDAVIALKENGARSNGFSLIRKILSEKFGAHWWKEGQEGQKGQKGQTWGDLVLTPSVVYHSAILELIGRHGKKRAINVRGMAHITGGGIPSKFRRVLKHSNCGASLDNLFAPPEWLTEIAVMGNVATEECYKTWCMGNGMLIVVDPEDAKNTLAIVKKNHLEAQVCGSITEDPAILVHGYDGSLMKFRAS